MNRQKAKRGDWRNGKVRIGISTPGSMKERKIPPIIVI
jgi:hypothetical protein